MRRILRIGLGLGLAGGFLFLVLRSVEPAELGAALRETRPEWLAAGVLAFALGYACRILRWRRMLLADNPRLGFADCAVPFLGSVALNNLLPLRAGDAMRAFGFSGWLGVSRAAVLGTMVTERLLDLLCLITAFALALVVLRPEGGGDLIGLGVSGLSLLALGILVLVFAPQALRPPVRVAVFFVHRLSPAAAARLDLAAGHLFATLARLSRGPETLRLTLWSVAVWICEGAVFWAAAMAVPAVTVPAAAWLALPVGTLATLLPSTPGYVGTFDWFTARAFAALDNPVAGATAAALVVHLLLWLPVTLAGAGCLGIGLAGGRRGSGGTL